MGNAGDKIVYSSSSLADAARRLRQVGAALQQEKSGLLSTLGQLDNGNGGDCRIQGRIHLAAAGASYSAGTIDGFIRDMGRALTAEGSYALNLASRLNTISEMFADTERALTGDINALFTADSPFGVGGAAVAGGVAGQGAAGKGTAGTKPGTNWGDRIKSSFSLSKLGTKVASSFGPFGKLIGTGIAVYEGITTGKWKSAAKEGAKTVVSWIDFCSKYKWSNFKKTNNFGNHYGTKNYFKKMTAPSVQVAKNAATKWGSRFVDNFKTGLKNKYHSPKTGVKWAGVVTTVIDLGFSAYDNYQQVKAGEITGDRAVVETVTETAANVLITTAATALVAALLPATAPAALIAVAGAGVVWAADGITKMITGGDKGLATVISEGVGAAYDAGKKIATKAAKATADFASKAIDKGAAFLNNLRKKVVGTSRACWI